MLKILEFVLSGFWIFVGFWILLGMIINFFFRIYNRMLRHLNIRKHGYPPNCDADGDFQTFDED